jgi:putative ABC transport system ATP-binding protein
MPAIVIATPPDRIDRFPIATVVAPPQLCHRMPVTTPTSATSADAAISARGLTLTLGSAAAPVEILKGIDLQVARGEVLALLGPSGSGKSSLMAVLTGLERASGGALMVAGADFSAMDEDALARARRGRIGIVLQAFHLLPTMTAVENVATPMELAGMPDARERAQAELHAVGLGHRLDHYPAQLSGGEQQRVAIARATAPRPDLLFADEPTGNLDGATGGTIVDLLLARRAEAGSTLLVITHDAELAARCDRVITLADGRIASDASIAGDARA